MRPCIKRKGFTLIEMLVVIAVIALLVSIIIPTVSSATKKARAATDAANIRSVLAEIDVALLNDTSLSIQEAANSATPIKCSSFPGASLQVVYSDPAFIDVFYCLSGNYYGLTYFSGVAESGSSSVSTASPVVPDGSSWVTVGG